MGYYIDFRFDLDEVKDWEEVVRRFEAHGARLFQWHEDDLVHYADYLKLNIQLNHPQLPFITVRKVEPKYGDWADMRLSWGMRPDEFSKVMNCATDLAEKIGARLFDGDNYVTRQDIGAATTRFLGAKRVVSGLIGSLEPSADDVPH